MQTISCSAGQCIAWRRFLFRRYTLAMPKSLLRLMVVFLALFFLLPALRSQTDAEDQAEQIAARAQQEMARGDDAAARRDFEQLARLQPEVAEVHATLAALDFQAQDYTDAVRQIQIAQKLKPGLPRLHALLALSQASLGEYRVAKPGLENCFRVQTDKALRRVCGLQLMRVDQGLEMDAEAVRVALALNEAYPDDPEILYHTGRVYGSYAFDVMQRLHDSAPDSIWMRMAQGEANESAGNFDAAISAYQNVLALDPHRAGIHYRLGRVYLRRFEASHEQSAQDQALAVAQFREELNVDPTDGNAAYEVANLDAARSHPEQAIAEYKSLLQQFPDFEQALVGLGGLEIQTGRFADAIARLQAAVRLNPRDEVAWYRLAMARRGTRDASGARAAMDAYLKLRAQPAAISSSELTPQTIGAQP